MFLKLRVNIKVCGVFNTRISSSLSGKDESHITIAVFHLCNFWRTYHAIFVLKIDSQGRVFTEQECHSCFMSKIGAPSEISCKSIHFTHKCLLLIPCLRTPYKQFFWVFWNVVVTSLLYTWERCIMQIFQVRVLLLKISIYCRIHHR